MARLVAIKADPATECHGEQRSPYGDYPRFASKRLLHPLTNGGLNISGDALENAQEVSLMRHQSEVASLIDDEQSL